MSDQDQKFVLEEQGTTRVCVKVPGGYVEIEIVIGSDGSIKITYNALDENFDFVSAHGSFGAAEAAVPDPEQTTGVSFGL